MKRNSLCNLMLLTLALAARGVWAQTTVTVAPPPGVEFFPGDIVVPPGAELPAGLNLPAPPTKAGGTNSAAKAVSPEDKRLQELLKLKFDRSATTIIKGLSAQFDPASAGTNEVEQFKQSVIIGDWSQVGRLLAALPKEHGAQVYRSLLRELPNTAKPAGAQPGGMPGPMMGDDQPVPMNPGQQGPGMIATPTLVVADVLALAEIAPGELTDADAKSLGLLLGKLLARGDALEPFLAKLETGVKQLGGGQPEARRRAAELLLAANRLTEAVAFFPTVDVAREKLDWRALEQHACDLAARGSREKDSKLLLQAWDLNQYIIGLTNAAATNREPALRRGMELLPQISREIGTNWLRERFLAAPAQGLGVFSVVNQLVQKGFTDRNAEARCKNLELQKQVVEIFLTAGDPTQPHWRTALHVLAQGWLQEATWAKQRYRPPRNFGPQYDSFGNMIGYENYPQEFNDGNQIPALAPDQVLAAAPGAGWLAQLDPSLQLATRKLIAELYSKTETPEPALPFIEAVAQVQPRTGADLASAFLRAWAEARNPNRNLQNQNRYYMGGAVYYGGNPYGQPRTGISLTRAMQGRNIKELAALMHRFAALSLPKLDNDAMVDAFAAAHSPAEVFKLEDIEAVFGARAEVKPDTLAGLAQAMRERLAQQWRQPRVQQEAKTQRTDKQIEEEILRGYDVVLQLVNDALHLDDRNWRLHLARASTLFDLAEFQYGKKVDLAIYVEKREAAFKEYEQAARLYAAALPEMEEKEETPLVYQQWFNANLGASDLAYVTRQQEPETNQLARVKSAIRALPGAAAERHFAAFAKQLGQSANSLRPELKPRYLRAGLEIVGNHPKAADARKLAAYYDDLLEELELVVRLDGDATVGHGRPFGVFVALRHTADLEREAGGFGRYLRNVKNSNPYYYNPYGGGQQRNFPEEFEKQVREKLADHYDVKSVTFLDDKVKSRGFGRPGWRETPLAYLLLQAKDGSVDQLPAFNMDLDFSDARGQVVLPVKSPVVLLDARPNRGPDRPLDKVEIVQTLDDREMAQGRITLEVKATANGLVPDLNELLRTNFTHLRIEEFGDHGLALNRLDAEADLLAPVSERNWLLKFALAEDAPAALDFKFPEPVRADAKITYKRYADADLVEVKPTLALAGVPLRPRPWWHWAVGILLIAGAVAALALWLRRKAHPAATLAPAYSLPTQVTPFALIQLLRRMESDATLPLGETPRSELLKTIRELEAHYFARSRNGHAEPDLARIGREWVDRVANGK
ncbi:MAG: hypothetical protein V9H26_24590 [Verrucomicrobiota bacterium]